MTSSHVRSEPRAPIDVPWDRARERHVLGLALDAKRRSAHRRWAIELTAALAVTVAAVRVLPRASVESSEVHPALAVPAAAIDADSEPDRVTPGSESAAKERKGRPMGGFAGTGGHGGAGSAGHGGSAGTG